MTERAKIRARAVPRSANGARRAITEDIREEKGSWLRHGVAALAVSMLGLGVAGSVALTGSAQHSTARVAEPKVQISIQPGVTQPSAFERDPDSTSRSGSRESMDPALVKSLAEQRIEALTRVDEQVNLAARSKAIKAREKTLESDSESARRQAALLAARQAAQGTGAGILTATGLTGTGSGCLPVVSGYTLAARFGQVGAWARYHTGLDFSAPVGTPIHAPTSGVVTNAGIGPASGWAGNYVAIRYANGTQSLMAHMSTVSVSVGQTVSPCQVVGAIGMTGRTFGPHVHFEIYPAGVTPGDVYKAVNPEPWLHNLGLHP